MERMELNMKQLENIVGGVVDSPEAKAFAEAVVKGFKELGYNRGQFMKELRNSGVEGEYYQFYLDCWDSFKK